MEQLRRLELAAQVPRHGLDRGLEHAAQPVVRDELLVVVLPLGRRAERVQVVEQTAGLVLLHVEAGEAQQASRVVPRVHDLRLDLHGRAVDVGRDRELVDVEAEVVEVLDAGRDAPPLVRVERLGRRQRLPQLLVARDERVADRDLVHVLVEQLAGGEVHELADDVRAREVDVVRALAGGELAVQVARLGVHEEGGERLRVAPEQRVRQRHVAPVEAHEVQAHEEDGERVDEARGRVRPQRLAEQRAVGERELEVLGDEHGLEPLAVRVLAPGDDAHRDDARHLEPAELPQQLVLAVRDRLADLLDRDHPPGEADEPHDVPRDAAGEGGERLRRPLLERDVPGQVEERRVGGRRGDLQVVHRHGSIVHGRGARAGPARPVRSDPPREEVGRVRRRRPRRGRPRPST